MEAGSIRQAQAGAISNVALEQKTAKYRERNIGAATKLFEQEASAPSVADSIKLSSPLVQDAQKALDKAELREDTKVSNMTSEQRNAAVKTLKLLEGKGRLFIPVNDEFIKRSNAMEAARNLDKGKPVCIVDLVGEQLNYNENSGVNYDYATSNIMIMQTERLDLNAFEGANFSKNQTYTACDVDNWEYLSFANLDAEGVKGAVFMKRDGGDVKVLSAKEEKNLNIDAEIINVLNSDILGGSSEKASASQGYIAGSQKPKA
ncbi:MAG: hypothetical protein LWY06_14725 [Firmicutes bacterium]|nr:hypothetical protein [Bacillota bacterium]